jgi:hypothetical protein
MLGLKSDRAALYDKHLKEGKFIVIVHGTDDEISKAKDILEAHGGHIELDIHL